VVLSHWSNGCAAPLRVSLLKLNFVFTSNSIAWHLDGCKEEGNKKVKQTKKGREKEEEENRKF
jgi:hypothetical protein